MDSNQKTKILTREKHLDHMVKVVPFIVMCYAIQCFVIYQMSPSEFSTWSLSILGGFIIMMISGFITYDLHHHVEFYEDHLVCDFLIFSHSVQYQDIVSIEIQEPGQTFSKLVVRTYSKKYSYYFVDEAEKIKSFIEDKKIVEQKAA